MGFFFFLGSVLTLHNPHWPSSFDNPHCRVNFQSCRRRIEWPIKTCAKTSRKPCENTVFQKSDIFKWFWEFFSLLVSLIGPIISSLLWCSSRRSFDRSLDGAATALKNSNKDIKTFEHIYFRLLRNIYFVTLLEGKVVAVRWVQTANNLPVFWTNTI